MTARVPMPVTAGLALALAAEGDVLACAERLAALDEAALRPVTALMTDILRPLLAMGAVTRDGGRSDIDRAALLRLGVGVLGLREDLLWQGMTLEALGAACAHWQAGLNAAAAPPARFLQEMTSRFPDRGHEGETG